jgi:hypothetical protein
MPRDEHGHNNRLAAAGSHFESDAEKLGVGIFIETAQIIVNPRFAIFVGHLGDVDGRLQRFNLAEEELAFTLRIVPVIQQQAGGLCNALVAAGAPCGYPGADSVDEGVLLNPILGPFRVEGQLDTLALLPGFGDGDKVGTNASSLDDFVGYPLIRKTEVSSGLLERGIDYRVLNDDLSDSDPPSWSNVSPRILPLRLEYGKRQKPISEMAGSVDSRPSQVKDGNDI